MRKKLKTFYLRGTMDGKTWGPILDGYEPIKFETTINDKGYFDRIPIFQKYILLSFKKVALWKKGAKKPSLFIKPYRVRKHA